MAKFQSYLGCEVCGREGGQGWRYVADRRRAVPRLWETDALDCRVQVYWQALVCCDDCEQAVYANKAWRPCDPDPNEWVPVPYRPPPKPAPRPKPIARLPPKPKPRPTHRWVQPPQFKPRPEPPMCSTPGCGRTIDESGGRCPQCRHRSEVRKIHKIRGSNSGRKK